MVCDMWMLISRSLRYVMCIEGKRAGYTNGELLGSVESGMSTGIKRLASQVHQTKHFKTLTHDEMQHGGSAELPPTFYVNHPPDVGLADCQPDLRKMNNIINPPVH